MQSHSDVYLHPLNIVHLHVASLLMISIQQDGLLCEGLGDILNSSKIQYHKIAFNIMLMLFYLYFYCILGVCVMCVYCILCVCVMCVCVPLVLTC